LCNENIDFENLQKSLLKIVVSVDRIYSS